MNANFDPYRIWLSIPVREQPPNHYRLLGIELFESDDEVISSAADRQMAHVRSFQSGAYSELSQMILNELAAARVTLLNKQKKTKYDAKLRSKLEEISSGAKTPNSVEIPPFIPPSVDESKDSNRGNDESTQKFISVLKEYSKNILNRRYAVALYSAIGIILFVIIGSIFWGGNKSNVPEPLNDKSSQNLVSDNETNNDNSQENEKLKNKAKAEELFKGIIEESFFQDIREDQWSEEQDEEDLQIILIKENDIDEVCKLDPECEIYKEYRDHTYQSRAIVEGLIWIARHQLPDGSWSFNHQLAPSCRGKCKNPGSLDKALNGATGLALLPFLYMGITHKEGKYKNRVLKGLDYLCKNGKYIRDINGCSFLDKDGTIYSHGIVTICLSEAYAMTKDKRLLPAAQGALNYISYHQDPTGGGWRYEPHQAGDVSATGWQMQAIQFGYYAGLRVPQKTINNAEKFLDSVQTDSGSKYGYTEPGMGKSTTAIGLLSRIYHGWKHDNPNLQRGVEWLSEIGPSESDCYYNYFASEVMHIYSGPLWKKWYAVIRDKLCNSQYQTASAYDSNHEIGSWYHNGEYSSQGGRLYDTAMSVMILETYYRFRPKEFYTTEEESSQD